MIVKSFEEIFPGLMRQKFNFCILLHLKCCVKLTKHFIIITSNQQSTTVVVVYWSGAALWLRDLEDLP